MYFLILLFSYLLGSIPTAYLAGKLWRGIDIRRYGSGNVGTMNARAVLGWGAAVPVFLLDLGKGMLVVYLARLAGLEGNIALLAAVVGHIYPVWLRWQGGKGLATAFGGLLLEQQFFGILAFCGVWLCIYLFSRDSDRAGLGGALAFTGLAAWRGVAPGKLWLVMIGLVVAWKHFVELTRKGR
ncbi:glycerol-3-phosphate acyltransferase PlsY [Thermacetogenium phaeum DSM 12270]|jgi:glycerol-3-phosphate acyltransferase PlsY|uniref:Glycerol-3-phosphate acyltransferase n=2 Tax=Thermacetogenium phaeum TaxID=85874 RepID=K4LDV6_THEPS|nr:glycerol-3-phosphate acyltransferase [Thermacetogenium phaeum]MDK2881186.1 acyl phosphate:glycerol-3-phosphate acyltransferase [Clostridia bacterium]MDN5365348.1 acyl phosphate:glycerol-3-phosphate acyltransferase [Thermacetogenium sp.]AFV11033.1 glycerol-3-phosphate acyltransferase PlsY [Thermacetogenium phaeum DSM 12270]KUK36399.1 MAG: Glycerol-3-phosphate acyltransferase [Thermacetogenium phaeum]MDN5376476.1 acyl phosphate:glycerol-3-phosphate acyltransferase [Thermacetogenium sp.]